ncbi:TolC family protein [Paraburkholderia megapolitana]|uniref:Outer membrane protein TolC n=1 Tax=Paraburkholderia megapolitana TaxID=420953 RepID=A0A1I3PTZ1_9BURK|nr:TolC family protein [Paraburkholderia megapolitana]QDQ80993.1 TolC family protein [Paraburkholderia megapolitana]SFJ24939.1 Outer membrane protein TolC [Paraburkholderia megapolitana]
MLFNIGSPASRRAWARSCVLLVALGLLSGRAAYAQDVGLTLDEALQIATSRSSSIQAAQASVRGSSDVVVKAGELPNPTLNLSVQDLPVNGPNALTIGQDNFTMRGIGIQQEWVSPAKRRLQTSLANRVVERDQSTYLEKVAEVRQQAAMAWLNAIYAKQAVALNQALVDHLGQELAARQASYRGAKGTAVDVAQANLTLGNARDELINAQQDAKTALIVLSRWTGAGNVLQVSGTPPEFESQVPSFSADHLAQVQPSLIAARAAISLADADTDVARSNRNPNWTWGLTYFKSGGKYPDYVSVGVTIPLPIHRSNVEDRDVAQKSEMGTQARLTYEDTERQVVADIQSLTAKLAGGRERLANAKQTVLPAAEQKVQLANAAYRSGAGTLADALDARHTQLEADLQVLNLEREVSLVWAQLEYQVLPTDLTASQ